MKTTEWDGLAAGDQMLESDDSNRVENGSTIAGVPELSKSPSERGGVSSPAPRRAPARPRRRWLPYAGCALLIGLITAGLWPSPIVVETTRATTGRLRATVNEEGKTRIKQRYLVSAPVTGQLRRIPFKPGAMVSAGETVVAVIEPISPILLDARTRSLAEARRNTAAAVLERARAQVTFAQSELRRVDSLARAGTVSAQDLENAQWRDTSAAKEMATAESALREVEAELADFVGRNSPGSAALPPVEVRSPTSGRILRVLEESSRVVPAGTALVEVGDSSDLEVIVEVLSRDGAAISPGTKVYLEQWGGAAPLEATVRLVEPAAFTKVSALGVEEQRVNVVADILTPAAQRSGLGDHFRVEARIVVWEAERVLKVPAGSLFRRGTSWAAFVVEGGRAVFRQVEVGHTSGSEMEVVGGLKEGDEVILYPGDRLQDGLRVRRVKI